MASRNSYGSFHYRKARRTTGIAPGKRIALKCHWTAISCFLILGMLQKCIFFGDNLEVADMGTSTNKTEVPISDRAFFAKKFNSQDFRTGVEVGVAEGRFAEHMMRASGLFPGFHYHLIEPFVNQELRHRLSITWSNLGITPNHYTLLPYTSLSWEALSSVPNVDFVYLDGLHTYDNLFKELHWYWPKVRPGGMFAGHDFCASRSTSLDAPQCGLYTERRQERQGQSVVPQDDVVRAVYDWLHYHPELHLRWTFENFTHESLQQQGYDYDLILTSTRNPSWYVYKSLDACGGYAIQDGAVLAIPDCPTSRSSGSCGQFVPLSIIVLYYGEREALFVLLQTFNHTWSDRVKQHVRVVIVDDGASVPAETVVSDLDLNLQICVATVSRDIPWNIGGSRNLGVYVAHAQFVFIFDMDCSVPVELVEYLLDLAFDSTISADAFIDFARISGGHPIHPHPAAMLIRSTTFWHVGGYDEDFVGAYGYTDVHFKHRLRNTTILGRPVQIRSMSDTPAPALYTNYSVIVRDSSRNKKLLDLKLSGTAPWSADILRFAWTVHDFSRIVKM